MLKGKKHEDVNLAAIYDWNNLIKADKAARKGKSKTYGVKLFDSKWWLNMTEIQHELETRTYKMSPLKFDLKICEYKIRNLAKGTYKDLVVQHALMQVVDKYIIKSLYYDSASSIKGKGIHFAVKRVRKFIDLNKYRHMWWTQIDFVKCYHHVKRDLLYNKICKLFADKDVRELFRLIVYALGNHNGLEEILNCNEGVGLGIYPVLLLINFYFNDLDRYINSLPNIKLFRYSDNILLIGFSSKDLYNAIIKIKEYIKTNLQQPIHSNIGILKLDNVHPIDFIGYLFYTTHTKIRKSTKYRFKRKANNLQSLISYKGWLQYCNGLHLWLKTTGMKSFNELNIKRTDINKDGKRFFEVPIVSASFLVNRELIVKDFEDNVETKHGCGRMCILVEENGTDKKFLTNNSRMKDVLYLIKDLNEFPFKTILRGRTLNGNKIDYYFE